jgi:hypothetical protein
MPQEASRLGAVERVVPREQLRATAREIAAKIAAKSPAMIRLAKEALNGIEDGNLEDKYRWEQGFHPGGLHHPDSQEARRAFVQKRDAREFAQPPRRRTSMDLVFSDTPQQAFREEVRAWLAENVPAEPLASFDTAEGFASTASGRHA